MEPSAEQIEGLCVALRAGNADAATVLGALGAGREALEAALDYDAPGFEGRWVRGAAAEALGHLGETASVPALVGRLHDHEVVVVAAAEAIARIGGPAESLDGVVVAGGWARARLSAARAELVGHTRSARTEEGPLLGPVTLASLRRRIEQDGEAWTQARYRRLCEVPRSALLRWLPRGPASVSWALGLRGDPSVLPALRAALSSGRTRAVRTRVAVAMASLGCADEVVEHLIARPRRLDYAATEALRWLADPSPAVERLRAQLEHRRLRPRQAAAEALSRMGHSEEAFVEALLRWRAHPDSRATALVALSRISDQPAVAARLAELCLQEPTRLEGASPRVAECIAECIAARACGPLPALAPLAALGPAASGARTLLREALRATYGEERALAARLLTRIADPRDAPLFVELLAEPSLRGAAAEALGRVGSPAQLPALLRCAEEALEVPGAELEPLVEAVRAIDPEALAPLWARAPTQLDVAAAFASGEAAFACLMAGLEGARPTRAALGLERMADPRAMEALLACFEASPASYDLYHGYLENAEEVRAHYLSVARALAALDEDERVLPALAEAGDRDRHDAVEDLAWEALSCAQAQLGLLEVDAIEAFCEVLQAEAEWTGRPHPGLDFAWRGLLRCAEAALQLGPKRLEGLPDPDAIEALATLWRSKLPRLQAALLCAAQRFEDHRRDAALEHARLLAGLAPRQ